MRINRDFIFDPSLVLYLPLYELDGASIKSKDAYGHLCTVTGALWRPNGHYFDGSDDNIASGAHTALAIADAITLEIWLNPDTTSGTKTVLEANTGASTGITLNINQGGAGEMQGWLYRVGLGWFGTPGTAVLTAGQFSHLVITYDRVNFKEYADGVFQDETAATEAIEVGATHSAQVGTDYAGNNDFQGIIGEVRIYNRALTSIEIQHNYLATEWRYR